MYQTECRCVKCKTAMSFNTKMDSHGTCPFCGNHVEGTVVDVTNHSYRLERIAPWWKFWVARFKRVYVS